MNERAENKTNNGEQKEKEQHHKQARKYVAK